MNVVEVQIVDATAHDRLCICCPPRPPSDDMGVLGGFWLGLVASSGAPIPFCREHRLAFFALVAARGGARVAPVPNGSPPPSSEKPS